MKKLSENQKGTARGGRRGDASKAKVQRKLVGVRIEPRLVKVMKAVAELNDCALGELIERVFWQSMENTSFFSQKGKMSSETKKRIQSLKEVYGVDYDLDYLTGDTGDSKKE